ncbi:MAG TPA: hypothetical protein VJP80_05735 [Candidatus Saccharimonadales bacterium]|nr:hypothetical protein [Candidatus Saccharimonadales bacterium]
MEDDKSREILAKLEELAQQPGFLRILADVMVSDMFYPVAEAVEVNWRERVSNQEATLLAGYMVKKPVYDAKLTQKDIDAAVAEMRKLLEELHHIQSMKMFESMSPDEFQGLAPEGVAAKLTEKYSQGSNMVEPIFYGDSGAYDFQWLDMAPRLYAEDKTWLEANYMDLVTAAKYYWAAYNTILAKASIGEIHKGQALAPIDAMTFSKHQLIEAAQKFNPGDRDISEESATKLLELFSTKPGGDTNKAFTTPGEYNVISSRPLIEVADDYYFLPVNLNLAEAIYVNPFYGMITDGAYKNEVAKHRGDAVEDITHDMLKGTFGEKVYKRVKVMKGRNALTDIDVMVVVGNKAIIFQCKGKKLTELSRRGDTDTLKRDFENAIQKSYNEAATIRTTLLGDDEYKLVDEAGAEIALPNGLNDAYIVCVTADVYPAALHQTSQYLQRKDGEPYCLPISLFDLETTAEYLKNPFEFLFYIKQRLDTVETMKAESEMAYLGYHLRRRLIMPEGKDRVLITQDFGQLIDADYLHRKGRLPEPPEEHRLISDEDNPSRARLIREISQYSSPDITDVLMFLYGISDDSLDELVGFMEQTKEKVRANGKTNDISAPIGGQWGGLTYVCATTYPELHKAMLSLAEINKHRFKSGQWLALGTVPSEERLVSYALYSDKPWEPSKQMDRAVELHERRGRAYKRQITEQKEAKLKARKARAKKKAARRNNRRRR